LVQDERLGITYLAPSGPLSLSTNVQELLSYDRKTIREFAAKRKRLKRWVGTLVILAAAGSFFLFMRRSGTSAQAGISGSSKNP
jgi:hypothetical protein